MSTITNEEQWKCRSCVRVFDTKGKRDAHHKRTHQVAAVDRSGIAHTHRSVDGKFVCECGNGYHRSQALKRHKESCYAAIAMIEGGGISLEQEEGSGPFFQYEQAINGRTDKSGNGYRRRCCRFVYDGPIR